MYGIYGDIRSVFESFCLGLLNARSTRQRILIPPPGDEMKTKVIKKVQRPPYEWKELRRGAKRVYVATPRTQLGSLKGTDMITPIRLFIIYW